MFKTLVATCLLTFSCSSSGLKINERLKKEANDTSYNVIGAYNFVDEFDFDDIEGSVSDIYVFNDISNNERLYNVPISYTENGTRYFKYLADIQFDVTATSHNVEIQFHVYDIYSDDNIIYNIPNGYTNTCDLYFYVNDLYVLHDNLKDTWNALFTHEDNEYVRTYTGWYTLNNNASSINGYFCLLGHVQFDNNIYFYLTNLSDGVLGGSYTSFWGSYYSVETLSYQNHQYNLPLDYKYVSSNQFYLTGVKMTDVDYYRLVNSGVFGYVPNVETSDFYDLMYSVMDSPLYMVSKLLNWELLGVNVFIALTGLLTLIVILTLIRKFW